MQDALFNPYKNVTTINLLNSQCLMSKVIRSYRLVKDVLYCRVDFLPDSADYLDDEHWSVTGPEYRFIRISAIVGPSASRKDDFKVDSMNCPRSLVVDEILLFCQTLKQMYQL